MSDSISSTIAYLLLRPLLRAEDITVWLSKHPHTVHRHLQQMEEAGLIEWVTPGTIANSQRVYYLTQAGLAFVVEWLRKQKIITTVQALARARGADEASILRLLPRLSSLLVMQNVIKSLATSAPEMLSYPNGYRAEITQHWVRDWRHDFLFRERPAHVTADATLLFGRSKKKNQPPEEYFPLLLVADAGLTGWTDALVMEQTIAQFLRYRESAERTLHYQQFPPVVVLVSAPHQREHWQRITSEVATHLRVDPLRGVIACIPPEQIDLSAWTLAWQSLDQHAPCRLQDYLVSMGEGALPEGLRPSRDFGQDALQRSARNNVVVRGHYSERARQRERGDQKEVAWLGMELSHREQRLLNTMYAAPLVSTDNIAALFNYQGDTAERAVWELQRLGCIEREATETGKRWRLSILGLRIVAAMLHVPMQHMTEWVADAQVQRGLLTLRRTIHHTAGLYGFLAQLHRAAAEQGHRINWWETGAWCERRYYDHGAWRNLRPDAALEYQTETRRVRLWVEWDRGQMTGAALDTKFAAYKYYVRSREWAKELRPLPTLLVVTSEAGQELRIGRIARQCAEAGLLIHTTTTTRLEQQGPLKPIWLTTLPGNQAPQRRAWLDSLAGNQPEAIARRQQA